MSRKKKNKNTSKQELLKTQAAANQVAIENLASQPASIQEEIKKERAWLSGLVGLITFLVIAFSFHGNNTLEHGIELFGTKVASTKHEILLFALLLISVAMFITEFIRYHISEQLPIISKHPEINLNLLYHCGIRYFENLILLWLVVAFYQSAGEYGFEAEAPFYQAWFLALDILWEIYLWCGLPYVFITRAFKYNAHFDQQSYGILVGRIVKLFISKFPNMGHMSPSLGDNEKQVFLDLIVKMFFAPLMIVFFCSNFPAVVDAIQIIKHGMPQGFGSQKVNGEIARIGIAFFFSAHTALAFSAYVLTSRWIGNRNKSINPKLTGWFACLLTFPPFTHMLITQHFSTPIDPYLVAPSPILSQIPNQSLVTIAIVLALIFYGLYLLSTLNLGMHFSNLSERKIITTGPYSVVRHPAYTCKMLGVFCITCPLVGLNIYDNNWIVAATLTAGYGFALFLYFLRAITEEKHLNGNASYHAYRSKVVYRFIPGLV